MIYVDEPKRYVTPLRYKVWAHMTSDLCDEELHAMAAKIGLSRNWFQAAQPQATDKLKRLYNHYDVTPNKRLLAIRYGVIALTDREFADRLIAPTVVSTIQWSRAKLREPADPSEIQGPVSWDNLGD